MAITAKNTARGMRGLHTTTGLVMFEAGETRTDLEISDAELNSARATGYFDIDGAAAAEAGDGAPALSDLKTNELEKIASDEGVDVAAITGTGANGRVLKADIVAAIEAKRAAPPAAPASELDGMSDDDLRATVQAITGAPAPADADRDALLGLARGQ